ncbi:hypothetical protein LCGC14_0717900 [marine sediment metagenome]|uniref:Terminase small subunit n=1 Tax=marine sediment metagenome TaxID=412755 RepID=A0A0F9SYM7_9ZZZZ
MPKNERLNPRQMKFVEGIDSGMSLADAYRKAGYKEGPGIYADASRLLRNGKVLAELDDRLFVSKRAAQQRFGKMQDGSTNVYVKILKMEPTEKDVQLLSLQQKIASDVFDRSGHKPPEQIEHSGEVGVNFLDVIMERKRQAEDE